MRPDNWKRAVSRITSSGGSHPSASEQYRSATSTCSIPQQWCSQSGSQSHAGLRLSPHSAHTSEPGAVLGTLPIRVLAQVVCRQQDRVPGLDRIVADEVGQRHRKSGRIPAELRAHDLDHLTDHVARVPRWRVDLVTMAAHASAQSGSDTLKLLISLVSEVSSFLAVSTSMGTPIRLGVLACAFGIAIVCPSISMATVRAIVRLFAR